MHQNTVSRDVKGGWAKQSTAYDSAVDFKFVIAVTRVCQYPIISAGDCGAVYADFLIGSGFALDLFDLSAIVFNIDNRENS